MDFSWTPAQEEIYTSIVHETARRFDRTQTSAPGPWTREQWRLCAAMGLLGLNLPRAFAGQEYGALSAARAIEAFGYACEDMGLVFSVAAHLFACATPIAEYGNRALQARILPGLAAGALIGANAITEQEAGSDVCALKTTAVQDGRSYILQGRKSYVSNGPLADLFVVYATTNPAHGYLGISAFVLERETPGLVVGKPFEKMGLTSTPACELFLEGCRVPETNRLGEEGQGSRIFQHSMQWERCCLFASYIGQMERQLERSIAYARERRQFGKALGRHQAIAHRLSDMKLRLEGARLLLYRACWLLDEGKDANMDISLAKLAVSEAAIQGGLDAIQIHGANGFSREYGVEQMLRDAIPATIFSGTSEIQRDMIARELGL
jgi:alkylation response protein AidB-like acyl-CoA dehydrogenase